MLKNQYNHRQLKHFLGGNFEVWIFLNSLDHTLCPFSRLRPALFTSRGPGRLWGGWWVPVWNVCRGSRWRCGVFSGVISGGRWGLRLELRRTGSCRLGLGLWRGVSVWWRGFGDSCLGSLAYGWRGCCCWRAGGAGTASTCLKLKYKEKY